LFEIPNGPKFYGYCENFDVAVEVLEGRPEVATLSNVLFLPGFDCLFDSRGNRIQSSCQIRWDGKNPTNRNMKGRSPRKVPIPKHFRRETRTHVYVHLSEASSHYGHFLLEGTTRFWYLTECPTYLPILYFGHMSSSTTDELVNRAGGLGDREWVKFSEPTVIGQVIVPSPSFTIGGTPNFKLHARFCEKVAKFYLAGKQIQPTDQPLYFSRRLLRHEVRQENLRHIIHEDQLEQRLQDKGVLVVYPERLSLEEQVCLVNRHKLVIGPIGSAMHNLLFDISENRRAIYLTGPSIIASFPNVDVIKDIDATYLCVNRVDPQDHHSCHWMRDRVLDVGKTMKLLENFNAI